MPCPSGGNPCLSCSISFTRRKARVPSLPSETHSTRNSGARMGSLNRLTQGAAMGQLHKTQSTRGWWPPLASSKRAVLRGWSIWIPALHGHGSLARKDIAPLLSPLQLKLSSKTPQANGCCIVRASWIWAWDAAKKDRETEKLRHTQGPSLKTAFVYNTTGYKPAFKFLAERCFGGSSLWKHVTLTRAASRSFVNSAYFQFIFHRLLHP